MLEGRYGGLEAGRIFARLLGAILDHGEAAVGDVGPGSGDGPSGRGFGGGELSGEHRRRHLRPLGDTIVVLGHLRGLSQAELAPRAGIRPNQISRYEAVQVLPQLGQLEKLLHALDIGPAGVRLRHGPASVAPHGCSMARSGCRSRSCCATP